MEALLSYNCRYPGQPTHAAARCSGTVPAILGTMPAWVTYSTRAEREHNPASTRFPAIWRALPGLRSDSCLWARLIVCRLSC